MFWPIAFTRLGSSRPPPVLVAIQTFARQEVRRPGPTRTRPLRVLCAKIPEFVRMWKPQVT
ncbi:hypothetical protein ANCDUO_07540 [Ancylostoma duodenale]|uniref:Uncharacterized protein n=1 Tax=Ancylostoma duodenale TaxID=51022 RepID=A0A0C2GYG8_9BILA|nr:hypothetical protein ANCDUO_07540 [Ancylostoma duodenale]